MLLKPVSARIVHVEAILHEGKVVLVATDEGGKIWYTVKQDGFEDSYLNRTTAVEGWEDWRELELPAEADDASVLAREREQLTYAQDGTERYLFRSRYHTRGQSAVAPVRLLSAMGHLYVFRQAKPEPDRDAAGQPRVGARRLLVDRYVLDGLSNRLVRKLDVRFKRSRQRYEPYKGEGADRRDGLATFDSVDFSDPEGRPFYEPTTELTLIDKLARGERSWFSVVLLPTVEHDRFRWHVFAANDAEETVELVSLMASEEGLFDPMDRLVLEPRPETLPGIVRRTLALSGPTGKLGKPTGLSAVSYDLQSEQRTGDGKTRLLRDAVRVMLTVSFASGETAALSFGVDGHGVLAELAQRPGPRRLRGDDRQVLLPPRTLEDVRAVGDERPRVEGEIRAFARDAGDKDRVLVTAERAGELETGDRVRIRGTAAYDGHYEVVARVDDNTFDVKAPADAAPAAGRWQKVEEEGAGQVFEGIITGYERLPKGQLRITALGHGLAKGDEVQIIDTGDYDETYPVVRVDGDRFALPRRWQPGEARNLARERRRRRGVTFEGRGDWIEAPGLEAPDPVGVGAECTFSAWIRLEGYNKESAAIIRRRDGQMELALVDGKVELRLFAGEQTFSVFDNIPPIEREWVHYAGTVATRRTDGAEWQELNLYKNGASLRSLGKARVSIEARFDELREKYRDFKRREEEAKRDKTPLRGWLGEAMEHNRKWRALESERSRLGERERGIRIGGGRIQVADAQVWSRARTAREIADTMYLELTGREPGLEAYWRLGAIVEEGRERRVVDFGPGGHHGTVRGTPWVGAATLERHLTLKDTAGRPLPATGFVNEELFAVSQRSRYEESFELRPRSAEGSLVEPHEDGFVFEVWGRKGRRSNERLPETPLRERPRIEKLADGWYRASCAYTVPDGVRMLRAFGIALEPEVKQGWQTMEVRRHRITLTSNTVSQVELSEEAKLKGAAAETRERQVGPEASYRKVVGELRPLEKEQSDLIAEKVSIQAKLAALGQGASSANLDQQIAELKRRIEQRKAAADQYAKDFEKWETTLRSAQAGITLYQHYNYEGDTLRVHLGFHNICYWRWNDKASSVRVPAGLQADLFDDEDYEGDRELVTGDKPRIRLSDEVSSVIVKTAAPEAYTEPSKIDERLRQLRGALVAENGEVARLEREKADLEELKSGALSNRESLQRRRTEVLGKLKTLQDQISKVNAAAVSILSATVSEPQAMHPPEASGGVSEPGVRGALVGFAPTPRGQSAFVACGGNVELHGFDGDGRALRRELDAVAESRNEKVEEWLPSPRQRACLDSSGAAAEVQLEKPIPLAPEWTIEAWIRTPLATSGPQANEDQAWQPNKWNTLVTCEDTKDAPITVENGQLGTWIGDQFHGSGFGLDRLDAGWHHLAAVGKNDTTSFFVDGEEAVSDELQKARHELEVLENGDPREGKELADLEEQLERPGGDPARLSKLKQRRDELAGRKEVKDRAAKIRTAREEVQKRRVGFQGRSPIAVLGSWKKSRNFGAFAEVRVWSTALTREELAANGTTTLTGNEPALEAYLPLDEAQGTRVRDATGRGHDGKIQGGQWQAFTGEMGLRTGAETAGAPAVAEYATYDTDRRNGRRSSMMRRLYAYPDVEGVRVVTGQRVETLDLVWVGNAQFQPTLLGYIEGAPPVPTENLTEEESYNGATSVELVMSEDVEFSWTREQEAGLGTNVELFAGVDQTVELTKSAGVGAEVGTTEKALETKAGFAGDLSLGYNFLNSSSVKAASGKTVSDRLELRGTREARARFPHLGPRFVPKNVGYALVVSALADVFISRLSRSGRMVGYQVLPIPEIPPDVNTITFLLNPAYTMQGSLDGLTGSAATSDRFFRHLPEMRSQYGSLYPASYYRLKEAYALKGQIEYRDKRREAYFRQFDARLVDEGAIGAAAEDSRFVTGAATVGRHDATAELDAEIERLESRIKALGNPPSSSPQKAELDKCRKSLEDRKAEKEHAFRMRVKDLESARNAERDGDADARRAEIQKRAADARQLAHATAAYAGWQKKMESIQVLAGKRNIANTYVWDADGGLHAESERFANTVEHTIGGSFTLDAGVGGQKGFQAFGVGFDLTAKATVHLTQTMTKTESRSTGFELNVDLSGVESSGVTDHDDLPLLPGEKVDRYRFTSFFLEGSTENYNDFFNQVVDPEWLAGNDEEARALRQARGKANKTWRVLHRVTYVERPALAGFGRDLRQLAAAASEEADRQAEILARLESLEGSMARLLEALPPRVGSAAPAIVPAPAMAAQAHDGGGTGKPLTVEA